MPLRSANVPADAVEALGALRARAVTTRGYARMFPDDRAGRTLHDLADELDVRASQIEAKAAARQGREKSRRKDIGFLRLHDQRASCCGRTMKGRLHSGGADHQALHEAPPSEGGAALSELGLLDMLERAARYRECARRFSDEQIRTTLMEFAVGLEQRATVLSTWYWQVAPLPSKRPTRR